jgi:hypothetical protein
MRLATEPEDDPSNEPISETNNDPEAAGNAGGVEFDTVGNKYDNMFVSKAERVSIDTETLDFLAKPRAVFNRKTDDAFHSVIKAWVPPTDALGDDSSDDICFPKTVANADPVAGRGFEENDDTETPE